MWAFCNLLTLVLSASPLDSEAVLDVNPVCQGLSVTVSPFPLSVRNHSVAKSCSSINDHLYLSIVICPISSLAWHPVDPEA